MSPFFRRKKEEEKPRLKLTLRSGESDYVEHLDIVLTNASRKDIEVRIFGNTITIAEFKGEE